MLRLTRRESAANPGRLTRAAFAMAVRQRARCKRQRMSTHHLGQHHWRCTMAASRPRNCVRLGFRTCLRRCCPLRRTRSWCSRWISPHPPMTISGGGHSSAALFPPSTGHSCALHSRSTTVPPLSTGCWVTWRQRWRHQAVVSPPSPALPSPGFAVTASAKLVRRALRSPAVQRWLLGATVARPTARWSRCRAQRRRQALASSPLSVVAPRVAPASPLPASARAMKPLDTLAERAATAQLASCRCAALALPCTALPDSRRRRRAARAVTTPTRTRREALVPSRAQTTIPRQSSTAAAVAPAAVAPALPQARTARAPTRAQVMSTAPVKAGWASATSC
mmetsp:Transcript_127724/g.310554  ORF Transcript_127724/g.310554 Transcript_127724/m.310554 type:complete len:337 (+) Transcript_127724:573-1583(+)